MLSIMSSSTEELDLLERVFLRVGFAESDEQLETAINKFLIPVLLKLSSPNEGVRKKVMELLVHINKRVKRQPTVQLPVEALLSQYRDPKASSFFINFSILYIKLGFPRLPESKQQELAPVLLLATEGKPKIHQDSLLLLLTVIIGNIKVPVDTAEARKLFKMDEKPELMKHFCNFMLDMLLLPYFYMGFSSEESSSSTPAVQAPPGMSESGFKRVTSGDILMTPDRLEQTKVGIVKFLATGIFSPNEIISHLIIAAADTRFTVANIADTELKRVAGSVDWSSITVATNLFHIYLGSPEVPADKRNLIPPANRVTPANTRIRLKIIPYLCRLEKDAILFPACVQVIFNSIYDPNTNARLKLQALNFALAIVRRADNQTMKKMGGILYTGLLKLVWNQEESEQLRVVGYTVIGQIVKRLPRIIDKNLIKLQTFFENLTCDSSDIRGAVRDALLTMIDAFKLFMKEDQADPKSDAQFFMMALLSAQAESKEPMARFVAVKYTAAVFEPDHVPSRYLLMLSAGDSNSDVSSVALQSAYASVEGEGAKDKIILPDFCKMSQFIFEKATERLKNVNQRVIIQNRELPFNDVTFTEALTYLRLCLAKSAGIEIKDKELITHPCQYSPQIGKYISEVHKADESIFNNYLSLVEMYLNATSSLIPLNCLLEVVGTVPEFFALRYAQQPWIRNFINSTKEDVREAGSFLISTVSVYTMNDDALSGVANELMGKLNTNLLESQHGAILTLGYLIERKISKAIADGQRFQDVITNWEFLGVVVVELAKHLESNHPMLITASCTALGQISKSLPLPLPVEAEEGLSKKKLKDSLIKIINTPKMSGKGKEAAIRTCGLLCLGEKFPFTKELIQEFLSIAKQTKDIDIHFSLGEALILSIEGISSAEKCDSWKSDRNQFVGPPIPEENLILMKTLIEELVELTAEPHPNTRQSLCVFFLSILKRLPHLDVVKEKLPTIQYVFMELLSENNELVQDLASKGLALVYENTTEENKQALVTGLLDQLVSGKRTVQKVSEDTKLFQEGELGVSPAGGNLSTYKELCNLASDLNQPDLIYKFMHLANHNAIWNSKKGAAFGFQTIASQANDQLNAYLPKIVPKLYRYQFDPTPRIQHSMANIWHSIVKSNQKTLDKYFHEILDDLLCNLISPHWRVRISCCLALADFFKGNRTLLDAKAKLPELWKSLFRVMDDIHEGTRLAAQTTGKTLANLSVRYCDKEAGKVNQEMLDISLSIFLSQITNPVAEVKNLCLQTVSQLVNAAGASLKPNLTTLISSLLEVSGELESVGLSYLSAHYGAQAQTQEVIDVVRANLTKSHYATQTVSKCVQYVEVDMLEALVPKIIEIMKSVSFNSRIACAHFIILLSQHLRRSMDQYTGKLLSGLVNGLLDKNSTVRKTYASAIGQILHAAKPSSVEKLLAKLSGWYFEKEDTNTRTAVGCTLQAIAQYNGELLKEQFPVVIPLIFFAMHGKKVEGEDNSSVIMWEEIWNDVAPGTETGIRQHMNEICNILQMALNSPSWTMKAQGGRCIATIATKLGNSMEEAHRNRLIEFTLPSLQGKTFPGKEDLLKGLSKLASHCADSLKVNPEKCQLIVDAILRECNKSDPMYKRHGVEALGTVLEAFDNIDYFQKVYEIIQNFIKQLGEKTEEGETSEELTRIRNEKYKTFEVIYETLGKSWPKKKETQLKYQEILLNECYKALETSPRDVQVAVLSAFRSYIEKLHYFNEEYPTSADEKEMLPVILEKTTQALHYSLGIPKHTRLRKEALNIVYSLGNKLNSTGRKAELKTLMDSLRTRLQELEKDSTPEVRTRLMDLKQMYKT